VLQEDFDRTKEERDANTDSLRVLQGRLDILKALGAIHIEDFQGNTTHFQSVPPFLVSLV
jgi:hypothetical protein